MSKSLKKILVSGVSLLLLASTGVSLASNNVNARRIHHPRIHRVYKHHRKHGRSRRQMTIKVSNKQSLSPNFYYKNDYTAKGHDLGKFTLHNRQAFHGFIDNMNRTTLNSYLARHNIDYRIGWIEATAGSDGNAENPSHKDEHRLCNTGVHDFKNGLAYAKKHHAVHIWYSSIGYTKWSSYRNRKTEKIIHTFHNPDFR